MYRASIVSNVALAIALLALPVVAQEQRASLPAELGLVKFRITAGRLQVVNAQYRESKTFEAGNPLVGSTETFRLNVSSNSASVHYRQSSPAETLTVDFDSQDSVVIQRTPGEDRDDSSLVAMRYQQPSDGPVQLVMGEGDRAREIKAASFWHLMLLARDDVEQHLTPVLLALRPGWQISETADGIEDALVKLAASDTLPDRQKWAKLVEQLGSSSFQQRRSAQRQLSEAGPAVVAYLNSLPLHKMGAERRVRIERLLESLSSSADDTASRIAMWLVDDPMIWTSVLASEDAARRATAKAQIEKWTGHNIEFDVDADDATRDRQLKKLRKMLEG